MSVYASVQLSDDADIRIRESELINEKFKVIAFGPSCDVYLTENLLQKLKQLLNN